MLEAALADLCELEFLVGPNHEADDLDIDPVFATPWSVVIEDAAQSLGLCMGEKGKVTSWCKRLASEACLEVFEEEILICSVEALDAGFDAGVVAISTSTAEPAVVGLYIGCQLGVADDWRGRGIGARLVKHRFLRDGGLPTWDLDAPSYSPGGQATHIAGFNLLHEHLDRLREIDSGSALDM